MRARHILHSWGKILSGHTPLLSIEITRECPLHCPGCYAYGPDHLGGGTTLRQLHDSRGDDLVRGVLGLVDRHRPLQVTLVGGEPMVRQRELDRILPQLAERGIFSLVVTSGIIPIPRAWMKLPRCVVAVSVDGLPEHHDVRRHPATYQRILENISGRTVNIHWTITSQMMERPGYLEEYIRFWNERPETHHIWVSIYSPQRGERSEERLGMGQRLRLTGELPQLAERYPKLLAPRGYTCALLLPPRSPKECTFSRLSKNYSADLETRVEPCVFGGNPDCSQCGCSASAAAHWVSSMRFGPVQVRHLLEGSMNIGAIVARLGRMSRPAWRERGTVAAAEQKKLVQISMD